MKNVLRKKKNWVQIHEDSSTNLQESQLTDEQPLLAKKTEKGFGKFAKTESKWRGQNPSSLQSPDDMIKSDLSMYLHEAKLDQESDPLKWWNVHKTLLSTFVKCGK